MSIRLRSERLLLRSTVERDRSLIVAIRQTKEVHQRWRGDDIAAEFDKDLQDEYSHQLTIENPSGDVIGLVQFGEDDEPDYWHASLDIFIDPSVHRRGYATEAIQALVDYLFDERGHHRLTIDPAADNIAAIECYRNLGFKRVGVLRNYERQLDGTWADGLLMELLVDDRLTSPR